MYYFDISLSIMNNIIIIFYPYDKIKAFTPSSSSLSGGTTRNDNDAARRGSSSFERCF
jgi:hypothetical protein